jgi:hypothetical protein
MKRKLSMTLLLAVCLGFISLYGQETRPAITPADYTKWQNLGSSSISDDGKWISWSIRMVDGDDSLFIKNTGYRKTLLICLYHQEYHSHPIQNGHR